MYCVIYSALCTVYCTVYCVLCTVFCVLYSVEAVQFIFCLSVHCTLCTVYSEEGREFCYKCSFMTRGRSSRQPPTIPTLSAWHDSVHSTQYIALCFLLSVHLTVYTEHCTLYTLQSTLFTAQFSVMPAVYRAKWRYSVLISAGPCFPPISAHSVHNCCGFSPGPGHYRMG